MRYVLAILLLLGAGCATPTHKATIDDRQIDWRRVGPVEHLRNLQALGERGWLFFTLWNPPPRDWVKETDVRVLRQLLDSNEPAAHAVPAPSSRLPRTMSTVGRQALLLIRAFWEGKYPPATGETGPSVLPEGHGPLAREQIIAVATAAAREHGWNLRESDVIYDEENAAWKALQYIMATPFPEFEGHDCQGVRFPLRYAALGGGLLVLVDKNTGAVVMVREEP
jgi:hypothetical protein